MRVVPSCVLNAGSAVTKRCKGLQVRVPASHWCQAAATRNGRTCQPPGVTHASADHALLAVLPEGEAAIGGPVDAVVGLVDAACIAQRAAGVLLVTPPQAGAVAAAVGAADGLACVGAPRCPGR
jgi:hypothetical protein